MRQNITLSLDQELLRQARAFAARRRISVSVMLSEELQRIVSDEATYEQAKAKAKAQLDAPFRLGGEKAASREALHDRQGLR